MGIAKTDGRSEPALAALVLGVCVLWLGLPGGAPRDATCLAPREAGSAASWTIDVRCDGSDVGVALRGPARILFDLPLDLNRADARALEVLPGIGPGRAAAIVAARRTRPLTTLAELEEIRGIGPRTVARLSAWAAVGKGGIGEFRHGQ